MRGTEYQPRKKAFDQDMIEGLEKSGAEGETRTPTGEPPLDPEPSASTNSATSATVWRICCVHFILSRLS